MLLHRPIRIRESIRPWDIRQFRNFYARLYGRIWQKFWNSNSCYGLSPRSFIMAMHVVKVLMFFILQIWQNVWRLAVCVVMVDRLVYRVGMADFFDLVGYVNYYLFLSSAMDFFTGLFLF